MQRTLYVTVDDADEARHIADEIYTHHRRYGDVASVMKMDGLRLMRLHQSNINERADVTQAMSIGAKYGAGIGLACGLMVYVLPAVGSALGAAALLMGPLLGGAFGIWIAGIVGLYLLNQCRRDSQGDAARTGIVMTVAADDSVLVEISKGIRHLHPKARLAVH